MNDAPNDSLVKSAGEALLTVLDLLRRLHAEQQGLAGASTVIPELETSIPVGSRWLSVCGGTPVAVVAHVWVPDHEMRHMPSVLYRYCEADIEGLYVADSATWTNRFERFQPA